MYVLYIYFYTIKLSIRLYIYMYHENNVPAQLSPSWPRGNSCLLKWVKKLN